MATVFPELRTIANNSLAWAVAATAMKVDLGPTRNRENWMTHNDPEIFVSLALRSDLSIPLVGRQAIGQPALRAIAG